jgi:4-hydroxybenzoate polyprenyltransferase/phosphoglycolate phosphatase-like HAD superfamily hydrolase
MAAVNAGVAQARPQLGASETVEPRLSRDQAREPEGTGTDAKPEWLCVDLDGTLVRSDTLAEGYFVLHPARAVSALLHLRNGRAAMKAFVARSGTFDPALLPYNEQLLDWLREQKARGRRIALTTAADIEIAQAIADYLDIFDDVIASDGVQNLKGPTKASMLLRRFGESGFTYIGDNVADLPAWRAATTRGVVNANRRTTDAVRRLGRIEVEINDRPSLLRAAITAMRPYQWVKNLLVFVPIVTAHAITDLSSWLDGILVFAAFCTCASGVYLANDLADLAADREHPRKRNRPLASGALPLLAGAFLSPALLGIGIVLGVASGAVVLLMAYVVLSLAYALKLKEMPMVDVFVLASLYTVRLAGGGEATGHGISLWLLAFSGFMFLSLALIKRVKEFTAAERARRPAVARRGYDAADAPILQLLGCAAAFSSCVVLALFVQSDATAERYAMPSLLWLIVPLMLFWQCRLWLWTARGQMHDDPIIFAARDRVSWFIGLAVVTVLLAAGPEFVQWW